MFPALAEFLKVGRERGEGEERGERGCLRKIVDY